MKKEDKEMSVVKQESTTNEIPFREQLNLQIGIETLNEKKLRNQLIYLESLEKTLNMQFQLLGINSNYRDDDKFISLYDSINNELIKMFVKEEDSK